MPLSLSHVPLLAAIVDVFRLNSPGASSKMRTPARLSASSGE